MSLNKFVDIAEHKAWMNINCHDIVCDSLTIAGQPQHASVLYLDSISPYVALDVTGIKVIINEAQGLDASITSLANGTSGQVIDLFTYYQGSQILVRHGQSVGGDQPINCNASVDTLVTSNNILGNTVGYAKLCYAPVLGWICVNTQPQAL